MYWISSFQRNIFLFQVTLIVILRYLEKNYHVAFLKDDEMFNIDVTTTCAFNSKNQVLLIVTTVVPTKSDSDIFFVYNC